MPIRDTSSGISISTNALIEGVYWAADHGAAVINLSVQYSGGDPYISDNSDPHNGAFLSQAILYAQTKGAVVVTASGNSSSNIDSSWLFPIDADDPSNHDVNPLPTNLIVAAAVDSSGNLTSQSNWGPVHVDLGASTTTTGETSYAAGYTSGVAGVISALLPPNHTAQAVTTDVLTTVNLHSQSVGSWSTTGGNISPAGAVAKAIASPVRQIIDDSSGSGFSTTATGGIPWQTWTASGYASTYKTAGGAGASQPANATATWTFNVTPGQYEVWVTWQQSPNRAVNAPFTVNDGTTVLANLAVDETQTPTGYYDSTGFSWNSLGERFQVNGTTLTISLSNQGVNSSQFVVADAVRINKTGPFYVDDSSGAVKTNGWTPWTGQGYSNTYATAPGAGIGTASDSTSASWNFSNLAAGWYEVWITWIADPHRATNAPFTVSNGASVVGTRFVNQSASATGYYAQGYAWSTLGIFQVTTSNEQTKTDGAITVLLGNHGVDASQFVVADAVRINRVGPYYMDDSDVTGFSTTNGQDGGTWHQWHSDPQHHEGFDYSHSTAPAGDGTTTATWKFDNLLPGVYEVWATWQQDGNRATNSPFSVYDDNTQQGSTIYKDQTQAPNDGIHFDYGSSWVVLGGNVSITSGTLKVVLTNQGIATGRYVVADAIRINRVGDPTGGGGVIESFAVRKAPSLAGNSVNQVSTLLQPVVGTGPSVTLWQSTHFFRRRGWDGAGVRFSSWFFDGHGKPKPKSDPKTSWGSRMPLSSGSTSATIHPRKRLFEAEGGGFLDREIISAGSIYSGGNKGTERIARAFAQ